MWKFEKNINISKTGSVPINVDPLAIWQKESRYSWAVIDIGIMWHFSFTAPYRDKIASIPSAVLAIKCNLVHKLRFHRPFDVNPGPFQTYVHYYWGMDSTRQKFLEDV